MYQYKVQKVTVVFPRIFGAPKNCRRKKIRAKSLDTQLSQSQRREHWRRETKLFTMADVDMYEESDYESDDFYDDDSDAEFDEENVVVASKPKKAAASKKSVLAPSKNSGNVPKAKASGKTAKGKKTIEEMYQKKTQLEHILLRPDTYSK